ncbi:MAG TPA: helix-turn-helix domain-containing protein [Nitrososphaeraceae archaeon]|nr:helix-turn-helix domain-containing protein [Nitrososphaeraceae archaeon]
MHIYTNVYKGNYLNYQDDYTTQSVMKETKRQNVKKLPVYDDDNDSCNFEGYDSQKLMLQTAKLRNLITKRGTFEMLIPLCCTTNPVRYKQFRELMKGISSKTLARRLKELERDGILERQAYNEILPRVEYKMTNKGQELVGSISNLIQWMIKWS